jgi:hypothetical protein
MEKQVQHSFTQVEVQRYFTALEKKLADNPLPTAGGGTRQAHPSEFMLMHIDWSTGSAVVGFKHRETRNYLFLVWGQANGAELVVPESEQPFMRGTFDYTPWVPPGRENAISNATP